MRKAVWYFDFISPYAYLQFHQLHRLPKDVQVIFRPVLFAGLLNHWGQLGPAEIPAKKFHTFLVTRWRARQMGLPFALPPRHPFNPLALLRMAIATGCNRDAIGTIFDHIWAEGQDGQSQESLSKLAQKLKINDPITAIQAVDVKAQLKSNTDDAIAQGIYGVPSFLIERQLFWGDDMFDMMLEWLDDPSVLDSPEVTNAKRIAPASVRPERG